MILVLFRAPAVFHQNRPKMRFSLNHKNGRKTLKNQYFLKIQKTISKL